MNLFEEININFKDKIILLDIDGTLVTDSDIDISESIIKKVLEIKKQNEIYLCTNKRNLERNKKIERILKLKIINSRFKKPNKKILSEFDHDDKKSKIVIGDKFLTDGIFAYRIGAKFIYVKRRSNGKETFFIKIVHLIDKLVYNLLRLVKLI